MTDLSSHPRHHYYDYRKFDISQVSLIDTKVEITLVHNEYLNSIFVIEELTRTYRFPTKFCCLFFLPVLKLRFSQRVVIKILFLTMQTRHLAGLFLDRINAELY